jgi:hypothetical protein
MKILLTYQGISIVVEVPIQAKMDYDDKDLTDFQFGSSQESEIDPPLVIDSVWDCPGVTLNTIKDDDGKTILGWRCGNCLIPSNRGGFVAPYKGEGHCHLYWLAAHSCKCCPCLDRIDVLKGK